MPEEQFERLGAALVSARKGRGFTQERLSDVSGVSVRYISKIEHGKVNPSYEVLGKLEKALGVSFDLFLNPATGQEEEMLQDIIRLYKACSLSGKRLIAATTRALANELMETTLGEQGKK